jgi:hypothetical protein
MLKSLDVVIGLAVVMLALSMAVTVITQTVTTILNTRGRHLRRGLTDLLQQLDPALTAALSKAVATHVLTHPLISGAAPPIAQGPPTSVIGGTVRWFRARLGGARLGNVVYREEFTKLLMALATPHGSQHLTQDVRDALVTALKNNGITDPEATLKNIRTFALQLERSNPALSHAMRQNIAMLHEAESDLVAKVNNWFDQSMDRTSQRFTASTRVITFAGAIIVAIGLQVDTLSLVNRLSVDDRLREALVQKAGTLREAAAPDAAPTPGATPSPAGGPARSPQEVAREYNEMLATFGIVRLPTPRGWVQSLGEANLFGLVITALLLSLGAPFWYSLLGRLLQLRSVLAAKDDAQRTERQTAQTAVATPVAGVPAASAAVVSGERGDLVAVG